MTKKFWAVLVSVGLMAGFQGAAFAADSTNWMQSLFGSQFAGSSSNEAAPDQQQIDADLARASQLQQTYQNDRQALDQAYQNLRQNQRAGVDTTADRQNIQNLSSAVNADIQNMRSNAQDLSKDGVENPYDIPYNSGNFGPNNGRWDNRSQGSYNHYNSRWNDRHNNNGRWQDTRGRWHDNNGRWQENPRDRRRSWDRQYRSSDND